MFAPDHTPGKNMGARAANPKPGVARPQPAQKSTQAAPVIATAVSEKKPSTAPVVAAATEPAKQNTSLFKAIRLTIRHLRKISPGSFYASVVTSAVSSAATGVRPIFWGGLVGSLATKGGPTALLMYVGFEALSGVVGFFKSASDKTSARAIAFADRLALASAVATVPFSKIQDPETKAKITQVSESSWRLERFTTKMFGSIGSFAAFVGCAWAMAAVSPGAMGAVILATVPLVLIESRGKSIVEEQEKALAPFYKKFWPTYWSVTRNWEAVEVRSSQKQGWLIDNLHELVDGYKKTTGRLFRFDLKKTAAYQALSMATAVGAVAWSYFQVQSGFMTVGHFTQFAAAVAALQITANRAVELWGDLRQSASFIGNLFQFSDQLNEESRTRLSDPKYQQKIEEFRGRLLSEPIEIQLEKVKFIVGDKCILDIDSLSIEPGMFYGLVGKKGAGKSTFISLLIGLQRPTEGDIFVKLGEDRFNLNEIPSEAWLSAIGLAMQSSYSASGHTVRDSIQEFGVLPSDRAPLSLSGAMHLTSADEFISAEQAQHTVIGEYNGGREFSGGELRSFANGRAIVGRRKLRILDEPTSNQDVESEMKLVESIARNHDGATHIISSHRFGTLGGADRILVLESGKIVESGSPRELATRPGGLYAKWLKMQADGLKLPDFD